MRLIQVFFMIVAAGLAGCASPVVVPQGSTTGVPAQGSLFSKINTGMSINQVVSVIGNAQFCDGQQASYTDKPGYVELVCHYKNEGVLVYSAGMGVLYKMIVNHHQDN